MTQDRAVLITILHSPAEHKFSIVGAASGYRLEQTLVYRYEYVDDHKDKRFIYEIMVDDRQSIDRTLESYRSDRKRVPILPGINSSSVRIGKEPDIGTTATGIVSFE